MSYKTQDSQKQGDRGKGGVLYDNTKTLSFVLSYDMQYAVMEGFV